MSGGIFLVFFFTYLNRVQIFKQLYVLIFPSLPPLSFFLFPSLSHIYIYIYIYMCVCVCVCECVCLHICVHVYIHIYPRLCTLTYTRIYVCGCTCIYMSASVCVCVSKIYRYIVIYKALCFDVAQGQINGAPNETDI